MGECVSSQGALGESALSESASSDSASNERALGPSVSSEIVRIPGVLVIAVLGLVLGLATPGVASTGAIAGRVTDAGGGVLPGAAITATQLATNGATATVSNAQGLYVLPDLAPGRYRLEVALDGFQTMVREPVVVRVDGRATVDAVLGVGARSERVEVEGGTSIVDRASAAVGTVVDRQFVENLPLNGRSFQSLLELTPGVVLARSTIQSPGQFSVNGQRTNANYFMVDGVGANIGASASATFFQQAGGTQPGLTILGGTNSLVSVDALQEFRVQTSTFAPEHGRSPGANISIVTRSGTNRLAGSAFEFVRHESLDANDWFANRAQVGKLPLRQHQFGGVAGGPIVLPALYDGRDTSFFFVSYEGLRLRQPRPEIQSVRVPSADARAQATGTLRDVFGVFPLPNAPAEAGDPAGTARYLVAVSEPSRFDATSVRLDHRIGARVTLFGRINEAPSSTVTRAFANQENATSIDTRTLTIGSTWTIASNLVADTRVNHSRSLGDFQFRTLEIDGARLIPDDVLFPSFTDPSRAAVALNFSIGGLPVTANRGKSLANGQRQVNLVQKVTWLVGRHELRAGVDYRRLSPDNSSREVSLLYAFMDVATALARGGPASVQVQGFAPESTFHLDNVSTFVQDTWRATPRLTLTYGARYDVNPPPDGARLPYTLDGLTGDPLTWRLGPAGAPLWRTDHGAIGPRIGASYLVSDTQDLVIRGGFGLFYDLGTESALRGYTSFPLSTSRVVPNVPFPAPEALIQPSPRNADPPYAGEFHVFEPDLQVPHTRQWNAAIERGLGPRQSITVSYVGAAGRDLLKVEGYRNRNADATTGAPAAIVLDPALFGTGTTASTVFVTRNTGESRYNALQVQFERRLTNGLQALASYTWSDSRDNVSSGAVFTIPSGGLPGFPVDTRGDEGPSDFDVRHSLTGSVTYDLPSPGRGVTRAILGGWGLDAIGRARSAFPFTVVTTSTDLLNIQSSRRVDVVSGVSPWIEDAAEPGGRRLDPAAFARPAAGQQGTLGRNTLRGFPAWQLDLSLRRTLALVQTWRLQLRADVFNLFNHPAFGDPSASLESTTFGRSTQMLGRSLGGGGTSGGYNPLYQIGGPRSIQVSAKVTF